MSTASGRHLRARHVHRVGAEHVGQRVSIRSWLDDPDRGRIATDVVGRLLACDDDVLLLVDRAGSLHVVDARAVLASRVVPPNPRSAPEPPLPTEQAPLPRRAARVLVLDRRERILLVGHLPDGRQRVWTAPGGGLLPGEQHRTAARREALEELGVELAIGPLVWTRRVVFAFRGVWLDQAEQWFLAHLDDLDPSAAPLDDVGTDAARWWSLDELRTTTATLAPTALPTHLARLLDEGPPDEPVDVGR